MFILISSTSSSLQHEIVKILTRKAEISFGVHNNMKYILSVLCNEGYLNAFNQYFAHLFNSLSTQPINIKIAHFLVSLLLTTKCREEFVTSSLNSFLVGVFWSPAIIVMYLNILAFLVRWREASGCASQVTERKVGEGVWIVVLGGVIRDLTHCILCDISGLLSRGGTSSRNAWRNRWGGMPGGMYCLY